MLEQFKAQGINIDVKGIDQAIENVENSKEEDMPQMDAGLYTNENQDVIVRMVMTQDDKEVMHSIGGKLGDGGVSEFQMGDQMFFSMKASKAGVDLNVKAKGMDIGLTIVPEEPSGINVTRWNHNDAQGPIYDLQGRKILGPLKAGIYIIQGKKILVK